MNKLVLQTDFGVDDGAVSAMYGVAYSLSPDLGISNLTHGIEPYDVWQASYRLVQTIAYWPAGTVFVSVVDPGVGSDRKSIVAKTKTGHYIVTPDNGTITHVWNKWGIEALRIIDESQNRRPDTEECYTFHGRDVYAYTGAKLAAGLMEYAQVGPLMSLEEAFQLPTIPPAYQEGIVSGTIDVLDIRFGSLWTNIPRQLFRQLGVAFGERVKVTIRNSMRTVYSNTMVYGRSFADVYIGEPLVYLNSLDCVAVAINQGSFSKAYNIKTGNDWLISIACDNGR